MRILLLNVPHESIGSRVPDEHLPPLGLLAIGGPLLDAGHAVRLLDADRDALPLDAVLAEVARDVPDAVLVGHSGSTSAPPIVARFTRAIRARTPGRGSSTAGCSRPATGARCSPRSRRSTRSCAARGRSPRSPSWTPSPAGPRSIPCPGSSFARRAAPSQHQVLATRAMAPWRVFAWVKAMEVALQLRPRAVWRALAHRDREIRDAQRWYYRVGRRVWFFELRNFALRDRRVGDGPTMEEFWGAPQHHEERALTLIPLRRKAA